MHDPTLASRVAQLVNAIELERRDLRLAVQANTVPDSPDVRTVVDRFVTAQGFSGLAERWREITCEAAFRHIGSLLYKDLVYKSQVMSVARAKELAHEVLALVPEARYFSNADMVDGLIQWDVMKSECVVVKSEFSDGVLVNYPLSSIDPIASSTVDSGVVMVSHERIGIFWVEDED